MLVDSTAGHDMTESSSENPSACASPRVRRFSSMEIAFHWWQAIPYPVLMATGGLIFLRNLLGDSPAGRTLAGVHKAAAGLWILALAVTVFVSLWTRTFKQIGRAHV